MGGDSDIDELLFRQGSLLLKVGSKYGINQDWIDLARGYIGDIVWPSDNNPADIKIQEPCPENRSDEDFKDFVEGTARKMVYDSLGGRFDCQEIDDTKKEIYSYVLGMVNSLMLKVARKENLNPDEEAFIRYSEVPVYLHVKITSTIKDDESGIYGVNPYTLSSLFALSMLKHLYEYTFKALDMYRTDLHNKSSRSIQVKRVIEEIKNFQLDILDNISRLNKVIHNKKMEYYKELELNLEAVKKFEEILTKYFPRHRD